MGFWIITGGMALLAGAVLALALMRGRAAPGAGFDLQVYRDQLAEVERDAARGVLAAEEAERVRTEVARRILAADKAAQDMPGAGPGQSAPVLAGGLALLVIGASVGIYVSQGAPDYGDLPLADRIAAAEARRADRPSQAEAVASVPPQPMPEPNADYAALVEQLRAAVAERPNDLQGHELLAQSEARLGNFSAAAKAQQGVMRIKGDAAGAEDLARYADLLILAAGGYVSPEAETALRRVLTLDAHSGSGRYYWGLMHAQTGRPDLAFRIWDALLREGPADAPWIEPIVAQIEEFALLAGVNYEMPQIGGARGPSQAEVEAAGEMTAAKRNQMIEGMVNSLVARLGSEGGPPQDWAQLITALGVLGRDAQAAVIVTEARTVFADTPGALDVINRAAEQAGVP